MQVNGRPRAPARARNVKGHNRYTSSSDSSFGPVASMSRSESGTSETHYEDRPATPPTKSLIEEFSQTGYTNGSTLNPSSSRRSKIRTSYDPVAIHLLVESAVEESQQFSILTVEELEQLKSQRTSLSRRIESTRRKLRLELKVRDAAKTFGKLDSPSRMQQMDDLPEGAEHADYEETSRRCEQYAHDLWRLERQDAELKNKQLQHTAGVLQISHQMQAKKSQSRSNGSRGVNGLDDDSDDEFAGSLGGGLDGIMDIPGTGSSDRDMLERLQNFNSSLYDIINSEGMRTSPQYPPPPPQGAGAEAELSYLEEGLGTVKELHQELMRYLAEVQEREMTSGGNSKETNQTLAGLWEIVGASENNHQQRKREIQQTGISAEESDYSDDEDDGDASFSVQNFSTKVHRLARRANNLSDKQVALHSQLSQAREEIQQQHESSKSHISTLEQTIANHETELESSRAAETDNARVPELEAEIAAITDKLQNAETSAKEHESSALDKAQRLEALESEKAEMEADLIRLQTEVTIAKAELDGAYGSRAERAAESASKEVTAESQRRQEVESKMETLQKELKEMVTEYEGLVKQGVEAERDREALEGMNDSLREKLEALEVRLSEEKVKHVGRGGNASSANLIVAKGQATDDATSKSPEPATVKVMREEFRKILKDMKVEHHESLRAELTERRKLEALVRTLRKDQQHPSSSGVPGSTLSPIGKKSGLSQSVTAS